VYVGCPAVEVGSAPETVQVFASSSSAFWILSSVSFSPACSSGVVASFAPLGSSAR